MTNEGLFVKIWVFYVAISAALYTLMVCLVNNQKFYKSSLDFAFIAPSVVQTHSRATHLILNLIKF